MGGHVSLHCSEKCIFIYHLECWGLFLTVEEVSEENYILQTPCTDIDCTGKFSKILWFNKNGDKIKTLCVKKKPKNGLKPKISNPVKVFDENEELESKINHETSAHNSKSTEALQVLIDNDKTDESSLGISTNILTTIDFEKLYEIDRELDEPCLLNEEWTSESATTKKLWNHWRRKKK